MNLAPPFMPLSASYLARIRPEDRFILAFPRSGSRWLRHALTDIVNQWQGFDPTHYYSSLRTSTAAPTHSDEFKGLVSQKVIPNIHHVEDLPVSHLEALCGAGVYRSHHLTEVLRRSQGLMLYMLRHPAATIASYYVFCQQGSMLAPGVTMEEFTKWKLPLWVDHVETMLEYRRANPANCLFFLYQDQTALTAPQVRTAASALGIPFTTEEVESALQRLRTHFEQLNSQPASPVPRGGNVQLLAQIPPALLEEIQTSTASLWAEVSRVAVEP
jgi:hypothetical protein